MILLLCFLIVAVEHVYSTEELPRANRPGEEMNRENRILIQDDYYTLVSKLNQQQIELDQLKTKMTALESKQGTRHSVAFNAHLTKPMSPAANQLIVFDDVRLNVGQAYHHGTFVAPYNGTYLFAMKVCSAHGHYIFVDMLRNGKMIGQVIAGDTAYGECSSETTVVVLTAGDDVIVQHRGSNGDYIHGDQSYQNSFTGVLLY